MKPLRLHLHTYVGTVLCILGCLALSLLGMFMLSNALQLIGERIQDGTWGALFGVMFYAIFSLGFTFAGLSGANWLAVEQPLWVEIGPQFVYCTLIGVHTHEWADIDSIQLNHTVNEHTDEDGDTHYSLSTSLVVTLSDKARIDLGASAYNHREKMIRSLVEGLIGGDSDTRRWSTTALGRFRADALPDLQQEMKRMCKAQRAAFRQQATEAEGRAAAFKALLDHVVPHLKTATQDTDEDVRKTASEALHRWGNRPLSPSRPVEVKENENGVPCDKSEPSPIKTSPCKMTPVLDEQVR